MKVMLLYGSPHENGCSAEIVRIMRERFEAAGLDAETFYVGPGPISGCFACRRCAALGRCMINDSVNDFLDAMETCDALVIACPVHFGCVPGPLISFLDRAFYAARRSSNGFAGKPAAAVVSTRRMGTTSAIDVLNRFINSMEMPLASGRYWPAVHGQTAAEIHQDEEGVQTLLDIADNMIWLLRCRENAGREGIGFPDKAPLPRTHFIRPS